MSACSASSLRPRLALITIVCAFALVAASLARDASARSRHGDPHTIRVQGDLDVNGRRVKVDDSVVVRHDQHGVTIDVDRDDDGDNDVTIGIDRGLDIETDDASIVRMFSDIEVDSLHEVDGSVVALFGNVTVRGRVQHDVVAVLGSVHLEPGSVVDGDAVAVGGRLDQPVGATVHGESVSLMFFPVLPGVPPLRAISLMLLVGWAIAVLLGIVLAMLVPKRMRNIADTISERIGWSLLLGFFLPPLAVMAGVLLMITMIGIPIAFLLPIVYLIVLWIGIVAATYLLGTRFMGRSVDEDGLFMPVLLGALVVAVMFGLGALLAGPPGGFGTIGILFPVLGLLFATALAVVGSGAVILSGFGSTSPRGVTELTSATSQPPPPAPPTEPAAPPVIA